MKEEVRKLWNLCFGDDEAFTELYFSKRYNDEVNLAIREEGKVVSALQILPYPMTFCGEIISTGYISGACTHPDYRSKGTMKRLLLNAFQRMQENSISLTTLIPAEEWLFDYYSRMGYTPVFKYSNQNYITKDLSPSSRFLISEFAPSDRDVHPYFDQKMRERPCCIQHPWEDFLVISDDLNLGKGKIIVARLEGKIAGLAFCYAKEGVLYVPELFFENDSARETLLYGAAEQMGAERISCTTPSADEKGKILGMARIIDAKRLLEIFAARYTELEISFRLTDSQIERNNAFYSIKSGRISADRLKESSLQIDVSQLTQAILGYKTEQLPRELQNFPKQTPYMSLMLN